MISATVDHLIGENIAEGIGSKNAGSGGIGLNGVEPGTTTIEWFGATTYRLRACGLTIFLDTWLEKPKILPTYLTIEEAGHVDYIFISHAHFDHLPGCDRLAKRTGAIVVANGEAINALREAGVPEDQLLPVSGGERVPLFTAEIRQCARKGQCPTAPGPPGAPPIPDESLAVMSVHVWPSLHCLLPGTSHADIPDVMDTATTYTGGSQYACTIDITRGMRHGLFRLGEIVPPEDLGDGDRSFIDYISDRKANLMSNFDGGQMVFSFQISGKTLMWNSHLGGYAGILEYLEPKPDVLILSVAGRANIDGRPFDGSAAEAATKITKWLGEPTEVIFCLYDEAPIKPWRVKTDAAKEMIESQTRSRVRHLEPTRRYELFAKERR